MSELYHAAQLPFDFSDTPSPKYLPRGRMSDKNNPPTEIRTCKKCGHERRPKWENIKSFPNGGRWTYRCYDCKQKQEVTSGWKTKWNAQRRTQRAHLKAENPELYREQSRRSRGKSKYRPERRRKLGITHEQYQAMWNAQSGLCAICRQPETRRLNGKTISLALDHDHATGQIRALLCTKCNVALGCVNDDVSRLQTMIDYVELYKRKAEDL